MTVIIFVIGIIVGYVLNYVLYFRKRDKFFKREYRKATNHLIEVQKTFNI